MFNYYGMRLRGFSPGCQPLVKFRKRMEDAMNAGQWVNEEEM